MNHLPLAFAMALSQLFPSQTHQFTNLSAGQTHYEDLGKGPVVVLVHGVSGPMTVWDKATPALVESGHRVIRFDLYGRGMSQRLTDSRYDLPLYVHQLEDLLKTLNVNESIHIVGSSFGAVIASEFTLQHPEKVASISLVGPAGFPIKTPLLAKLKDIPIIGSLLEPLMAKSVIKKQNRKYAYRDDLFTEFWPYFDAQLDIEGTTQAMLATMKNAPVTNYIESYRALGALKIPTQIIWGKQDVTFPYMNHESLMKAIPHALLTPVEAAAHLPQWEQPELFNAALVQFLKQ